MKIAIATDAWHPQVNGVVRSLATTVERLRRRGHEVMVLEPGRFRTIPCPTYPEIRLAFACGPKNSSGAPKEATHERPADPHVTAFRP